MDFAADAVADLIAPPPRAAANAKAAPADKSAPSFDDHLDAATADDAPAEAAPTPPVDAADDADSTDSIVCADQPSPAQPAAAQPEPTAAPILVQLIAAATPPTQTTNETPVAPAPGPAPATAPDSAALAPIAATPDKSLTPDAPAEAACAESQTPAQNKSAPANAAPSPQQNAMAQDAASAPVAATPIAAPTAAPVNTPAVPTDPAAQAAALAALTPPATPSAGAREAPARTAKADATAAPEFKAPATDAEASAPQAAATKNAGPKNAPAPPIAKANAAPAPVADSAAQTQTPAPAAPAQTTTQAQHVALEQSAVRAAPAAAQVAREIVRRFDGETQRFELRLDPPELGRVEVRLEVSRDHRVTAVVSADSPQALTELARHARELEQTLQSAGLELSDNGLSFDLRQGSGDAQQTNDDKNSSFAGLTGEQAPQEAPATARPLGFERWRGVRVDVMA